MSRDDIVRAAREAVINYDEEAAVAAAMRAIEEGIDPVDVITNGLSDGMAEVGAQFAREELPLPYVMVAAEAMQKAIKVLEPHIPAGHSGEKKGIVVIGTVEGDIHDIGKTIVATMLRAYGFEVHDLGRDVPLDEFVEKARSLNATIVGASTLMTTTMVGQKVLIEKLKTAGLPVKTMVGGAPITQEWADRIGADAYAEDAIEAVAKANELVG